MGMIDIFEDLLQRNEKQMTEFAAELLQNERFTEGLVKAIEMATEARNQMDRRMQGTLKSFNLPSRREFETLGEKVKDLAKILSDLDNRISRFGRQLDERLQAASGNAETEAKLAEAESELKKKDKDLKAREKKIKELEKALEESGGAAAN